MKARNREINIFNMSLLDILCGALGAFCFMMLSLLPYYHPPGEDFKKVSEEQKKMLDEVKDVKDLLEKLKFTSNAEDQRELVKMLQDRIGALENRIKELQGQVNGLLAERDQLKAKIQNLEQEKQQLLAQLQERDARISMLEERNQKLEDENKKLKTVWDRRIPWAITLTSSDPTQSIRCRLFLQSNAGENAKDFPDYDPADNLVYLEQGDNFFPVGSSLVYVVADRLANRQKKMYVTLQGDPSLQKAVSISGAMVGSGFDAIRIPPVDLSPQRPWALVGRIVGGEDRIPRFVPASPAERDAEWERLTKTKPPEVADANKPSIPPNRQDAIEEARRRGQGMPGGFSPAASQRLRNFAVALSTAQTPEEKREIYNKAVQSAEDEKERAAMGAMMARENMTAPPAPPPAIPSPVSPSPK